MAIMVNAMAGRTRQGGSWPGDKLHLKRLNSLNFDKFGMEIANAPLKPLRFWAFLSDASLYTDPAGSKGPGEVYHQLRAAEALCTLKGDVDNRMVILRFEAFPRKGGIWSIRTVPVFLHDSLDQWVLWEPWRYSSQGVCFWTDTMSTFQPIWLERRCVAFRLFFGPRDNVHIEADLGGCLVTSED
jgi:hypothetical protein